MAGIRPLVAGNWKMNGLRADLNEADQINLPDGTDVVICPPATLIPHLISRATGRIGTLHVGAQDCHFASSGAHTGDISAEMIADAGASHVIVGHSERRTDHGESSEMVRAKGTAAIRAGLIAIVCVGETEAERDAGKAQEIVRAQIDASLPDGATSQTMVIAYEPVWAIGTGRTPTLDEIAEMHDFMRATLAERMGSDGNGVRLLYGGSVKPANAAEIFRIDNVNGGLVGGASLKAADFNGIIGAI